MKITNQFDHLTKHMLIMKNHELSQAITIQKSYNPYRNRSMTIVI